MIAIEMITLLALVIYFLSCSLSFALGIYLGQWLRRHE